mgnify:CR=1 FL=1
MCNCWCSLWIEKCIWKKPSSGTSKLEEIASLLNESSTAQEKLLKLIDYYQTNISPEIKRGLCVDKICRYTPSCSGYSEEAIEKYGPTKGLEMTMFRLLRCNPFSKGGCDPVPVH